MSKLIVIVGVTGTQGSSVAATFLEERNYRVRGITRDVSKPASQALAAKGVEMVQGDTNDLSTLISAFKGANVIFGNTAFSHAIAKPTEADLARLKPGQTIRALCYDDEVQQGKNVVDAVATVGTPLERFVWSTLSKSRKWSKGKYCGVYHFDSKAAVVDYMNAEHPDVAARSSLLQLGLFVTNWRWGQGAVPWEKRPDGSMCLRIPGSGNEPIPLVNPADTGMFVRALLQVPAGKHLLAFGDRITWSEYVEIWTKVTGIKAILERSEVADQDKNFPGGYGEEIGEMYAYAKEFGYDGGDPSVIYPDSLGVDIQATRVEDYIRAEDWSSLVG